MTGLNNAHDLTLEFEGDTLIGSSAVRKIWYYRIKIGNQYLTDATRTTGADYVYNFNGVNYPYAFFRSKLANYAPYAQGNITADQYFVQTFGFRYVVDDQDPEQKFYIVSNANHREVPTKEGDFRYLALINNQLVFVKTKVDALVFQWGKIQNGGYVDLEVIGKANIFGVEGGVKFLNTTGKVDIFTIDGRLIKSAVLTGGEQTIEAPRGIAVVKNGSNVVKVVVQ
jgi:hypothetical protein